MSTILVLLISLLYIILIKSGFEKSDINLQNCIKKTGIVEKFGIDFYRNGRGKSDVFYIKLNTYKHKLGVYRASRNYKDLLNTVETGQVLKAYFFDHHNEHENVNIDLVQLEKNGKIIIPKSEYEKKEGTLIFIGLGGLIGNCFLLYYSRKKYLQEVKASGNSR